MRGGNDIKLSRNASPDVVALAGEVQRLFDDMRASPMLLPSNTVAFWLAVDAALWTDCAVIVTDEVDGRTIATSDGSNWCRVKDDAVIS